MMMNRRGFAAQTVAAVLAGLGGSQVGCSTGPSGWHAPSVTRIFAPRPVSANPLAVPSTDFENVWNKTVAVVDKYFDIESENRLSRTIKTQPQMGATVLEPWALDSATIEDRVRGQPPDHPHGSPSFISIRHRPGDFSSRWKCTSSWKTWPSPTGRPAGRAVFTNDFPVNRTREIVGPVPAPLGWINGDGTWTWSRPSWPASETRSFCKGTPRLRCHPDGSALAHDLTSLRHLSVGVERPVRTQAGDPDPADRGIEQGCPMGG